MRVHTKVVLDWDGNVLEDEWYEYKGPVAECKGDGTAKDQLKLQNQLVQQALARQTAMQDKAAALFDPNQGFSPELLAALNSQFLNSNASSFNAAGSAVRDALASRGAGMGNVPVGGDYVRGIVGLEGAKANSQSGGLLGIAIQDALQRQQNRNNLANVLTGNAAQSGNNVGTFNSGANNDLNTYVAAANTGFGNAFTSAFGGTLGKGLGGALTGGIGGLGSNIGAGFGGGFYTGSGGRG